MNKLLTLLKFRATSKVWRLFLLMIAVIPVLLLSQPSLARASLYLQLRNGEYYNHEAKAEQDNKFFLDVRNSGTEIITNIKLSAKAPEGWLISITPAEMSSLSVSRLETVDVNIRPAGKALKASHQISFTAEANEVRQVQSFSVTVLPAQSWIWVWITAGVLVVAGFVIIYLKLSKQA